MLNLHLYKNDELMTVCGCSNHAEGHKIVKLLSEEYDRIEGHSEAISSYYLYTYHNRKNEIPAFCYCSEDF